MFLKSETTKTRNNTCFLNFNTFDRKRRQTKTVRKAYVFFTHLMENWGAPPGASGGLSFRRVFLGPAAGPLLLEIKKHVKTLLFSTQRPPEHVKTHSFSKPKRAKEGAPRRAERALSRARMGAKRAQESPGTQESSGRPRRTHESLGKPRRSLS